MPRTARCSRGTSRCSARYWTAADIAIQHIAKEGGGFDKLKGKKIALVYHDSPYGKEPIAALEARAKKHGFEFKADPGHASGRRAEVALAGDPPEPAGLRPALGLGRDEPARRSRKRPAVGYPRDKMIGVWWSGAEPDVTPAGDQPTGYKALMLQHGAGKFSVHADMEKHVYRQGQRSSGSRTRSAKCSTTAAWSTPCSAWRRSAPRRKKFGNKPLTGEQVRWGLREPQHHRCTHQGTRLRGHGEADQDVLLTTTRARDEARVQQWDGKGWKIISDWYTADQTITRTDGQGCFREVCRGEEDHAARLLEGELNASQRHREAAFAASRISRKRNRLERAACQSPTAARRQKPAALFLSVNNIEVVYSHVILVLKGVSLDVPQGGIVALLGANGAGKTTTLKAISNLLHAERGEVTKGSILFDGERGALPVRRTIWCGAAASR